MGIDLKTLAAAKKYISDSLQGAGALKGKDGKDGESAYQIAVNNGFIGNQSQWLESLKGKDGNDGLDGEDGNDGISIIDVDIDASNNHLITTMSNGEKIDAGNFTIDTEKIIGEVTATEDDVNEMLDDIFGK